MADDVAAGLVDGEHEFIANAGFDARVVERGAQQRTDLAHLLGPGRKAALEQDLGTVRMHALDQQQGSVVDQAQVLEFREHAAQARFGGCAGMSLDQRAHTLRADGLALRVAHIGDAVGEAVQRGLVEIDLVAVEGHARKDAEWRAARQELGELAAPIQQGRRKSGCGDMHMPGQAVAMADQGADEAPIEAGLAELLVDALEPRFGRRALLADPAQQRGDANHQQGRIEALARDIADEEADAPVGQIEVVVEIAGNLVCRQVHPEQRETVATALRQQRFLHAPGEVEFALHARLLDQFIGHARIVDGQRGRRRDQAQDLGIVGGERTTAALVDHFERADRSLGRGQRRAQQAARDEAGIAVGGMVDA